MSAQTAPAVESTGAGLLGVPGYVLALDIGGTKLAAGVVRPDGRMSSFQVVPSRTALGPDVVLEDLFALGRQAVAESGVPWAEIEAVGIGCGGPLDAARGVLIAPPHLPGWHDIPVAGLAQAAFERPALLENDATAAAAAEHRYGAGVGTRNMVYLTISTGVGGGAVIDGRLYRGSAGNGGEFGHVTVDCNGRLCRGCGRRGCLEAYVSGTSIAERALAGIEASSSLAKLAEPTAADVVAAAASGDAYARRVWTETLDALACGLTSIVNLFEPDLVVLGGGVTRAGAALLDPVRASVRKQAMAPAGRTVDIVAAALGERVGVVGAAAIVFAAGDGERVQGV
jgi:glucokinase